LRRLFSSRSRPGSRPASIFSQSRHCLVLRSARYPCQVSVSDSPPSITLLGAPVLSLRRSGRPYVLCRLLPYSVLPDQAFRFVSQPKHCGRDCGMHATPTVYRCSSPPVLTLPGAPALRFAGRTAPTSPLIPGVPLEDTLQCAQPRGLESVSRPVSMFSAVETLRRAQVCSQPLPGIGL
jgi:hypothetical protein